MRLLPLLFLIVCVATSPDSLDDEDDDVDEEETPHLKPRVAWVPIVQRNVTVAVGEVIHGEKHGQEKLNRIGKMLEGSNDQWTRDAAEGDIKFRQLEQRRNSVVSSIPFVIPLLLPIVL